MIMIIGVGMEGGRCRADTTFNRGWAGRLRILKQALLSFCQMISIQLHLRIISEHLNLMLDLFLPDIPCSTITIIGGSYKNNLNES